MTKQILAFLFCFIRELNPYSPLGARTQNPPPPRANSNLYSPLTLTLTLRPPMVSRFEQKISLQQKRCNYKTNSSVTSIRHQCADV